MPFILELCSCPRLRPRGVRTCELKRVKIEIVGRATTPPTIFGLVHCSESMDHSKVQATTDVCQLLVRHLPQWLTQEEKESFLSHFGAAEVISMPPRGRMVCPCDPSGLVYTCSLFAY